MRRDDARHRPARVVMLVDNDVSRDSRVQKIAQSAAAAGWDVLLLGRSPTGHEQRWRLGGAQVRLLAMPVPAAAAPRRLLARRVRVRAALRRWVRHPWDRVYAWFWQAVQGDRAWRRLAPGLWGYERAYGPAVDEAAPDLIHAHDFRMLGVGARAVVRARAAGRPVRLVWDAHEYLPGIRPWQDSPRWMPAHRAHEREYAPYADAVITVSDSLAELLQRDHGLPERPAVVLNTPAVDHGPAGTVPDLRARCGIGPDVPLVVYSGAAAPQRGLDTMVEALPHLPEVHVALVVNPESPYVQRLVGRAAGLGAGGRLHVLPYVPHWQVVPFLSAADVGVIPIHHWPNHELALITKFFEYSHAHLPLVVSDVRTMAGTVRATGQGEVFRAGDVADYVRAVRAVLADPARYRAAYADPALLAGWTWAAQAAVLDGVYRGLLPAYLHPEPPPSDPDGSPRPGAGGTATAQGALA